MKIDNGQSTENIFSQIIDLILDNLTGLIMIAIILITGTFVFFRIRKVTEGSVNPQLKGNTHND